MKVVYKLLHKRKVEIVDNEIIYDTKLLGFFSSEEKCQEAINYYIEREGFKKYPDDFVVYSVDANVDDYNDGSSEFDESVYYLSHEWYDGEYDYVTHIGYYSTQEKAEAAKSLFQVDEKFIDYQDGFVVDVYVIDEMEWKDGFCSWSEINSLE